MIVAGHATVHLMRGGQMKNDDVVTETVITCPVCRFSTVATMPEHG